MREIPYEKVVEAVKEMCILSNSVLGEDVYKALEEAFKREESPVGKEVLKQIIENDRIAKEEMLPICQDTGTAVVFVELGEEVRIKGGYLKEAIYEGVRRGYDEGYLRKSMVVDPLRRKNTGDNTPPIIHIELFPDDRLKITVAPKGGGSENMSVARLFPPAVGREGIKRFVVETVERAGGNPCPPVIVGVGIGGNFEYSAYLAKKAILRPIGSRNPDPYYGELEEEILEEINKLGIGPMGVGGNITAFDVHIEAYPCHIASLPVAVNIQCHAARHLSREL
jgi:fumarate hydratase subunit alpha